MPRVSSRRTATAIATSSAAPTTARTPSWPVATGIAEYANGISRAAATSRFRSSSPRSSRPAATSSATAASVTRNRVQSPPPREASVTWNPADRCSSIPSTSARAAASSQRGWRASRNAAA